MLTGTTTYNVTVPGGATVTINGVSVTGGGTVNPAPAFSSGGEAVTTKFERGAGDTWAITAFAELDNDAIGADVPNDAIMVYRGDTVGGITNAVVPTITGKSFMRAGCCLFDDGEQATSSTATVARMTIVDFLF